MTTSTTEQISAPKKYPELKKIGRRYWYADKVLSETEMQDVLLSLGNPGLKEQIRVARLCRKWQHIGFLAIPLGVAGVAYMAKSQESINEKQQMEYKKIGQTLLGLAVISVGASISLKNKRNQRNAETLRLYRLNY
ncbi:MAG: hypothetical protein H0W84_13690 [Bacteroidetes bacterium]|nr:hypothetical protein [Bacteroidota bacterium]